jgi:hypothetical protein
MKSFEVELSNDSGSETLIISDCHNMDDCIIKVRESNPDSTIEFIGVC